MTRMLFCPVCGARVTVDVGNGESSTEKHIIPEHVNGDGGNICQTMVVTVGWDYASCSKCKQCTRKHPSEMCARCYSDTSAW